MKNSNLYDIYIVGIGIKWKQHITFEVDEILGKCNEIFYIEKSPTIRDYFLEKTSLVTDLTELYEENADREETYNQMAMKVISAATEHQPVALALYGHPTVFAYPPFLIKEMASHLDLSVKFLPGISAMDTLFCDLAIDPSVNGLQLLEATDLLLRRRSLDPTKATLIWQIGSLGTSLFSTAESLPERFKPIQKYLTEYFPPDHPVFSVFTSPHPGLRSQIYEFKLEEMIDFAPVLHSAVTIYIPPASIIFDFDQDVVKNLHNSDELHKVTASKE
ncbi:MAG: SAM-dependent methyltransferase [Lentilitoribacter sp.]